MRHPTPSNRPLTGKRVVVTRAWHQAADFMQKLEAAGAEALHYPCVEIVPPEDVTQLDACLDELLKGRFDWLVLTSQNTVLALASRLKTSGKLLRWPQHLQFAAVGPSTAHAAKDFLGIDIHRMPQVFDAESLAHLLRDCEDQRIFLPHADIARPELADKLRQKRADVKSVVAYHTMKGSGGIKISEYLANQGVDAITFASPSALHYFVERLHDEGLDLNSIVGICIACIGHVTEQAAQKIGLNVSVSPKHHTVDGLIHSLEEFFHDA